MNDPNRTFRVNKASRIRSHDAPLMKELGQTVPKTWEEFAALGAALGPKGYGLGSAVEPFPLISYLVSGGCELAIPVEGTQDSLKINATSDACVKAATMVDIMVANGSLAKTGPVDPAFVALAKSGKVPLIIGPTWFGEYSDQEARSDPGGCSCRVAGHGHLPFRAGPCPIRIAYGCRKRLSHHVNILEMNGDSYRLGQSRARKTDANT